MIARARYVLPIDVPPIENGWVELRDGIVHAIGTGSAPGAASDLGDAAILPGLINAHTHLELSWMAGRTPPSASMSDWIRGLMTVRRTSPPEHMQAETAASALAAARARGTIAFGDISNTLVTAPVLASAGVPSVLFHELLGFGPHDADARAEAAASAVAERTRPPVAPGLAPHAPYSTSPELFAALGREAAHRTLPVSVHLAESPEETEFLRSGRGPFRSLLEELGVWRDDWRAPACGPVEYLERLGALTPGLLAVHATQLDRVALDKLAARDAVIVSCPRSNRWVGAGDPPIDAFYASGATVAFGTDSLASAPDLDMFAELAAARALASVSDSALLESATRGGAVALRLGERYGRIAPGCRAPLLAVAVPPGVTDVQEYLVSGLPRDIQWIG